MIKTGFAYKMVGSGMPPLLWFGLFVLGSWMARGVAHSVKSVPVQYLCLFGFIVLKSIIFAPLFLYVVTYADPNGADKILVNAVGITLVGFAALTAIVFMTRKDFSFLRGVLFWGALCAMGAVVAALVFGFALGPFFCIAMIGLAGAGILYDTSNVIHHYREHQHAAAALELFASVTLLLFYVINLLLKMRE